MNKKDRSAYNPRLDACDKSVKEIVSTSAKNNLRQYTMVIALLAIWLLFTILTDGIFITSRNLSNLFLQTATIGILACGMVLVMVAGHIDLSVGSVAGTLGALAAFLMVKMHVNPMTAMLLTLIAGILVGSWHGYWVAYRGVPALIVTLASMTAFHGVTQGITKGATIGELPGVFKALGQGYVPKIVFKDVAINDASIFIGVLFIILFVIFNLKKRNSRIKYGFEVLPMPLQIARITVISFVIAIVDLIMASYLGIPYAVLLLTITVLIFTFITGRTSFGRYVYAIGGNKEAARLSGIDIKKTTLMIFMLMGALNAVAAMVFTARLNAATTAAGNLFELDAIAACVIGGTSTSGGVGRVFGAAIGALVMASLDNGMSLMNLDITYQYIIKGMVLLLAVWVDFATKKK